MVAEPHRLIPRCSFWNRQMQVIAETAVQRIFGRAKMGLIDGLSDLDMSPRIRNDGVIWQASLPRGTGHMARPAAGQWVANDGSHAICLLRGSGRWRLCSCVVGRRLTLFRRQRSGPQSPERERSRASSLLHLMAVVLLPAWT